MNFRYQQIRGSDRVTGQLSDLLNITILQNLYIIFLDLTFLRNQVGRIDMHDQLLEAKGETRGNHLTTFELRLSSRRQSITNPKSIALDSLSMLSMMSRHRRPADTGVQTSNNHVRMAILSCLF